MTGAPRRREGAWPPSGSPEPLRATSNAHPLRHSRSHPALSLCPRQASLRCHYFQSRLRDRHQWRAPCHCQGMFPVMVCGRERVSRSGGSLSRPCDQRRRGVLSTLQSVRTSAIGDAKMVRLRHRYPKCRRDPVARMIDTDHSVISSLSMST